MDTAGRLTMRSILGRPRAFPSPEFLAEKMLVRSCHEGIETIRPGPPQWFRISGVPQAKRSGCPMFIEIARSRIAVLP